MNNTKNIYSTLCYTNSLDYLVLRVNHLQDAYIGNLKSMNTRCIQQYLRKK